MSRFVWAMAWRETRGSLRHFLFFFACITVGVAGLVGVTGFASSLESAIRKEGRKLVAGDLEIRSHRPLSPHGLEVIQALRDRGILATTVYELIAMASDRERSLTQLVELKAVAAGYPFYGRLVTEPSGAANSSLNTDNALVEEALMVRLGLQTGDRIRLGQAEFTIAGILKKEPDRVAGIFSLGPRVMISEEGLAATGLIQPGSRIRYRTLLKLPQTVDIKSTQREIEASLSSEKATITSFEEAQPRLRRFLKNLNIYLGLVGLTALLVGGIGVASSVQVFLRGKLDTLAILKCLGARSGTILGVYLLQTLLLGLVGCLAGVGLGLGIQRFFPFLLSDFLPVDLVWKVSFPPVVQGIAMGLLTTLLFSLWPLLGVRRASPAHVFRRDFTPIESGMSREGKQAPFTSILISAVIIGGLGLLALWQAGSFRVGGLFLGVLAASLLLLRLGAALAIRIVTSARRPKSIVWRHGLANLHRPGSQAKLAVLSIGIGVTVILAIHLVETSLLRQVGDNVPKDAPSFFFIDIQVDQKDQFKQLLLQREKIADFIPVVRGRLHAVGDKNVADMDLEGRSDAWYFQREYVFTSQESLPRDNKVKRGGWWSTQDYLGRSLISVEEEMAHHLGVDIGSTLTFNIQGVLITAAVTSIREVNWGNMSTNFFVIFSPGTLEGAPTTYIATVRSRPEEDIWLQRSVVSAFPNVTAINTRHVLDTIRHVLQQIGLVVRFMGIFTIAAGFVVLSGVIAATRHWRTRESVILKTLGATRALVAQTFAVEYAVLGTIAGLVGAVMASLLAFIFLKFIMEVPWQLQPIALLIAIGATLILTVISGFLTTFRILGQKPLAVLRHE